MIRRRSDLEREVRLTKPSRRDRDRFLAAVRASQRLHRPWVYPPASHDAYSAYLKRIRSAAHEGFAIRLAASDELVGVVNLNQITRGALQSAYLGFYVFVPHDGTGRFAAGLEQVIRHSFASLRLHRLEANVQPANKRSLALVRRLGFEREGFSPRYLKIGGRWRDHERWALRVESWRQTSVRGASDRVEES